MKLLFIVDDYSGGAGNIVQLLALEYFHKGCCVEIVRLNPHSNPRYDLTGIICSDYPLDQYVSSNKAKMLCQEIDTVKQAIRQADPDVVISFLDGNNILACLAMRKMKTPIIVSERSNPVVIKLRFPWNILRDFAYRKADIVTVQFDCFQSFANNKFKNKCMTTPNVVLEAAHEKDYADICMNSQTVFVACGRLHPIKNYEGMIALFAEIVKQQPNCILNIYGEGQNRKQLEALITAKRLENCVFLKGPVSDVYKVLAQSDIFLMTSIQEGFPNALSEAMAVGLPCLVYRCHDGFDELINCGENGFLVNPSEDDKFVELAVYLSTHTEERMKIGLSAKKIANNYSMDRITGIWDKCLIRAMQMTKNDFYDGVAK